MFQGILIRDMPARFIADAMLARLARWLRVLGFDTFFDPAVHDRAARMAGDRHGSIIAACHPSFP